MLKLFCLSLVALAACFLQAAFSFAAADHSRVNVLAYSGTNVTTGAYVQLIASTATSTSHLEICDTSGQSLKIATGAASSEVDIASTTVSGCVYINYYIPAGTRLSIEAINASATTGYSIVSLIP